MGQKVHPTGFRLGVSTQWTSTWFADSKSFAKYLNNDIQVRDYLKKKLAHASVSKIQIERPARSAFITIHTARPGIVIGKKGEDIERLRAEVAPMLGLDVANVKVNVEEIRKPEMDAQLVAESITQQLEKRIMFRRAMKRAVQNTMRLGAQGIKIIMSGRLGGAEPLHTLRAEIDYGFAEAKTTYGVIGVKVLVYKGEVFGVQDAAAAKKAKG